MKPVNFEIYGKMLKNNCSKGKHRYYQNRFGVTWCTLCGCLSNADVPVDSETKQPINPHEPLVISAV